MNKQFLLTLCLTKMIYTGLREFDISSFANDIRCYFYQKTGFEQELYLAMHKNIGVFAFFYNSDACKPFLIVVLQVSQKHYIPMDSVSGHIRAPL